MNIELDRISKSFMLPDSAGRQEVLSEVSLTIASGDSLAIVGPSGSGKSTLLNILGTLDSPNSGRVLFDGQDVSSLSKKELSVLRNQRIGFIFQLHHLLPQLTLLENALLPVLALKDKQRLEKAQARVHDLLETVGIADKAAKKPGVCSVGECQRAAVVRALINEPGLILADEPTGSLDHRSALQMGDLLANVRETYGVAIVVVTHARDLANKMTRKYHLEDGKLIKK